MLAADADARVDAALEVSAENIGGARREALIELAVEGGVVAEKVRDAGARVPAERLVAVAVFQIMDRVDEIIGVERGRAGPATPRNLFRRETVAEVRDIVIFLPVTRSEHNSLRDIPRQLRIVHRLPAPVLDLVTVRPQIRQVTDVQFLEIRIRNRARTIRIGEDRIDVNADT